MEFECCIFFFLIYQRVQILKADYKYHQYCTPLSQSDCRFFFRVSDNTSFSSFSTFCVFCFELNVLNQDINICVIIIKRSSCYVILSSLYKNSGSSHRKSSMEKLLLKIWQYSQENNCVGVSF